MALAHLKKTLTFNDAGGVQTYSAIVYDGLGTDFGQVHAVLARLSASTYAAYTAGEIRACRYPHPITTAVDALGRPTAAISAFDAPDEDVFYKSGAFAGGVLAAMVASATAAFWSENVPVVSRRGPKGPWCVSIRINSGVGGTATCVMGFEFDLQNSN